MSQFKYKTRGNSNPKGKPRVYFCCHPEDFKRYFESVSNEILAKQNCAVWYTNEAITRDEDFFLDLKQMQLFVMPVTTNLLCTENEALDIEFNFAIENHIPVLPLMQESGLEELFNKKCGDLQFLDKNNADITAISYDEKLQKYLESVLIGDELAEKIRAAFDAYVFLSYRKKDRKHAQELMRLIHKNEFCRDIAIWYDEFLTPGENFNNSIKEALQKSGLFVLTVTPNLVNETNYIMTTEYPMAKEEGKLILPAELVPTNREELSKKYAEIPNPTNAYNEAELSEALLDSIKKMAIKENENSPEHNFFIGLAYLGGVDVEVDNERALSLITSAAEANLFEAMQKLANMYFEGESVARNTEEAIYWYKHIIKLRTETYNNISSKNNLIKLINAFDDLGDAYEKLRRNKDAVDLYQQLSDLCKKHLAEREEDIDLLRMQSHIRGRLGYAIKLIGNNTNAFEEYRKAYELALEIQNKTQDDEDILRCLRIQISIGAIFEEQFEVIEAKRIFLAILDALNNINDTTSMEYISIANHVHIKLGDVSYKTGDYSVVLENYRKALDLSVQLSYDGSITNRLNVAIVHYKIGHVLLKINKECDATDEYLASYEIVTGIYKDSPTLDVQRQLMIISSHLGEINMNRKDYDFAEEFYQDAMDVARNLANTHTTIESYSDYRVSCDKLASLYEVMGKPKKALLLRFSELEVARKIADITHSRKDLMDLTSSYNSLANVLRMLGKDEEALGQYLNAYRLRKIMAEQLEPWALEALQYSCHCVGEVYIALGDVDEARVYYKEAIDVCEKLVSKKSTTETLDILGTSYVDLASLEEGDEQLKLLNKALSIYEKLCVENPDDLRFKSDHAALSKAVANATKKKFSIIRLIKKIFRN